MAVHTPYYNLIKPGQDDLYNINDSNDNMDKIDAALKQAGITLDATAAYSSSAFTLANLPDTLPNKFTLRFTAPADYTAGDKLKVGDIEISVAIIGRTTAAKSKLFLQNQLVSFDVCRGTDGVYRAFFKSGGGGYGILPTQTQITAATPGDGKATITLTNPYSNSEHYAGTTLVAKDFTMPDDENDGLVFNAGKASSFVLQPLINDMLYTIRAFARNSDGELQTDINGAVVQVQVGALPPGNTTGVYVVAGYRSITVRWADPVNANGAVWAGTMLRYKAGSYPVDETDGTLAINSTVRNQYATNGFTINNLTGGTTYYLQLFPRSNQGTVNRAPENRRTGVPQSGLAIITVATLSLARHSIATASNANYAFFVGGASGSGTITYPTAVDWYNSSLSHGTAANVSASGGYKLSASVGEYALFGCGQNTNNVVSQNMDAYNSSAAKIVATAFPDARCLGAGATIGDYALFGGGSVAGVGTVATVYSYNASLVRGTASSLSSTALTNGAATIGNYALFGGGKAQGSTVGINNVDTYTASLAKGTAAALSVARGGIAATATHNHALFFGGNTGNTQLTTVDAYTSSLSRVAVAQLPSDMALARTSLNIAAAADGDYAIYIGDGTTNAVVYTSTLAQFRVGTLGLLYTSIASIGKYAIAAGGRSGSTAQASAQAYYPY